MEESLIGNSDIRVLEREALFLEPTEHSSANVGLECILFVSPHCVNYSRFYCVSSSIKIPSCSLHHVDQGL
uniref:Uncharacterized protein n=1 Tax=Arundo donax TaxID=35708 RepID=A0A0A9ER58_ARUDO